MGEQHAQVDEYFSLAADSFSFCSAYKKQVVIDPAEPQKVLASAFFAKLLRDAEGANFLLSHGMVSQARSLLRVAIECEIILAKCCKSPEFCESYRLVNEQDRLKLLKGVRKITAGSFDDVRDLFTEEMVNALAKSLKGTEEKQLERWARDVERNDLYQTGYRLYSRDVHAGAFCMQQFLKYDSEGNPYEVNWHPSGDCRIELIEVSRLALSALNLIGWLYKWTYDEPLKAHQANHERLEKLVEQE